MITQKITKKSQKKCINSVFSNTLKVLILMISIGISAQDTTTFIIPDSLKLLDYKSLESRLANQNLKDNMELSFFYANIYFQKAAIEQEPLYIAKGYSFRAGVHLKNEEYDTSISLLDSAIQVSSSLENNRYPTLFFMRKAGFYTVIGDFNKAFDNYLIALEWCKKRDNPDLEHITNHNIGVLKQRLGKYGEAKELFKKCMAYRFAKEEVTPRDSLGYLVVLSDLIGTYRQSKQIDSARMFNQRGIKLSEGKNMNYLFRLNEKYFDLHNEVYDHIVQDIDSLLPKFLKPEKQWFFGLTDLKIAYLYQGKATEALGKKKEAIQYYKKVDSLIQQTNYINPELTVTYEKLVNYYKATGDTKQQLKYIDRLLRADSILNNNYRDLNTRLIKDFDTPELLNQKEEIIKNLEKEQYLATIKILILLIVVGIGGVLLVLLLKRQKRYKQRFEKLIGDTAIEKKHEEEKLVKKTQTNDHKNNIGISNEIVTMILGQLDSFEKKQGYIKTNLTTHGLATSFGTNSKYLSKVINRYKYKNFVQYVNDLRIDFIVTLLRTETKYQKYTIQALARECGFNTTEAFSKSFYKKTGIYPSYFIKQLEKQL